MIKNYNDINIGAFQQDSNLKKHISLCDSVKSKFSDDSNIFFLKVPGRVNLIGEHVDYNSGTVLPCAIDREIIICLTENASGIVNVSNVNSEYSEFQFSARSLIEPFEKGNWGNYIKAGVKGIVDYLYQSNGFNPDEIIGFDAVISSTLPAAAGLSSSSTLVVGAALAFLTVNNITLDNLKVAEICAEAEHFVGTAGGGMDHAAILLGNKNSFSKIDFNPLTAQSVTAPDDIDIILFHSLVEAEKSSNVRKEYNRRVLECHFAMDLFNLFISDRLSKEIDPPKFIGDITPQYLHLSQSELENIISEFINSLPDIYSLSDLLSQFNVSRDELADRYQNILGGDELSDIQEGYKLKGRFRHVYSECQRVETAVIYLQKNEKLELGKLIKASHKSLAEDYEVSTPEVDAIVNLLDKFGALGSRIVGAGFGGMVLALSDQSHSDDLIEKMKESFYSKKLSQNIDNYIIRCQTADGAGLL